MSGDRPPDRGRIVVADGTEAVEQVRALFREYRALPHTEGRWPGSEAEIVGLPGRYASPRGVLLLAFVDHVPVGCVGIMPMSESICELKRLYLSPPARGLGLGRRLAVAAIDFATEAGYDAVRLDTVPELGAANALYAQLGFREIPCYHDLYADATCYELELGGRG